MDESRRARNKRAIRQRITTAARRLFAAHGYEATTVAQIAEAADVDAKTFFNHFRTKADVLFGEGDLELDVLLEIVAQPRAGETPGEVLRRAVLGYAEHRRLVTEPLDDRDLALTAEIAATTPAVQAHVLYLLQSSQRRLAEALSASFPELVDSITAASLVGATIGAIQQATLAAAGAGVPQTELWKASERALAIVMDGALSVGRDDAQKGT